jgi:hypothetical protein
MLCCSRRRSHTCWRFVFCVTSPWPLTSWYALLPSCHRSALYLSLLCLMWLLPLHSYTSMLHTCTYPNTINSGNKVATCGHIFHEKWYTPSLALPCLPLPSIALPCTSRTLSPLSPHSIGKKEKWKKCAFCPHSKVCANQNYPQ